VNRGDGRENQSCLGCRDGVNPYFPINPRREKGATTGEGTLPGSLVVADCMKTADGTWATWRQSPNLVGIEFCDLRGPHRGSSTAHRLERAIAEVPLAVLPSFNHERAQ